MKNIEARKFINPPKNYSMAPFWFWNDGLDSEKLLYQLQEMYDKGVYECVIHARRGLEVDYLSEEWFGKIREVAGYAKKLGMRLWIYDENNWPSGYADGKVIAEDPDYAATCLSVEKIYPVMYQDIQVREVEGKELAAVVAVYKNQDFFDITDYENHCCKPWHSESLSWEVFVFRMEKCAHKAVYSNFPYVDLLNPKATQAFIRHTHAEYKKRLPEYWGNTICGFFTDEPGFYQNYFVQAKNINTVIWTRDFPERFKKKFGYDIVPYLGALWEDMENISDWVRRDYYSAVSAFYCESYFDKIREFLSQDGLSLIGHLHREEGFSSLLQTEGDFFDCMNALDIPGIDLIDRKFPRMTEKLVSSAMRTFGKRRCFSESFGTFGWGFSLQDLKRYTDLQFVQGVNMLIPHAFFSSIEGFRKTECPPSFFVENGYWKYFRQYADYVSRLSYFCTAGTAEISVGIYYPLLSARINFMPLNQYDAIRKDETIIKMGELLQKTGYDYDFISDQLLTNSAKMRNFGYRVIILPRTDVVSLVVAKKLLRYASGGGKIICLGENYGGISSELDSVKNIFEKTKKTGNLFFAETEKESLDLIKKWLLPIPLGGEREGVLAMKRKDKGREYYFLINTQEEKKNCSLTINNACAQQWFPETGKIQQLQAVAEGKINKIYFEIPSYGSVIVAIGTSEQNMLPMQEHKDGRVITERKLTKKWQAFSPEGEIKCCPLSFHAAGYHGYSGEVEFRKTISVKDLSERAHLEFKGTEGYLALYVNGTFAGARLWAPFDFDIGSCLKKGKNEITLVVGNMLENALEGKDKDAGVFGNTILRL